MSNRIWNRNQVPITVQFWTDHSNTHIQIVAEDRAMCGRTPLADMWVKIGMRRTVTCETCQTVRAMIESGARFGPDKESVVPRGN